MPKIPADLAEIIAVHKAIFGGFVMEAEGGDGDGGGDNRTFTQAELNDIVGRRVAAERSKFGDYDALKAKAEAHDKSEEASKGELQKAIDRATAAEKKVADYEAAEAKRQADAEQAEQITKWTAAAAKKHGVPVEAIKGATEQEISEHAKTLAGLLPRRGSAPREGEQPNDGGTSELQAFARQLFNKD